jgi:hypothetical protein
MGAARNLRLLWVNLLNGELANENLADPVAARQPGKVNCCKPVDSFR